MKQVFIFEDTVSDKNRSAKHGFCEAKCFWSFKSVIFEERIIMVDLTGKRVIVVGTGISGIGSAGLL
ncbi:MAG: hypothetical protein UHN47_08140, partial [Lachnospiraceae bacterium]|nr:hypothetical protein [Lachnospiraceae bacterium]